MLSIEAVIRSDDTVIITRLDQADETIDETVSQVPGIWEATRTPEDVRNALVAANLTPRFTEAANYYSQECVDGEWMETFSVSGPVEDSAAYEWTFEVSPDGEMFQVVDFGKGTLTGAGDAEDAADNFNEGQDSPGVYRLREYYGDSENGILTDESVWDSRPDLSVSGKLLTGGLLQCRRERMGLSREVLANLLAQTPAAWEARGANAPPVSVDMVRQWERGRDSIPPWVEPALARCVAEWQRAVDELVEVLASHPGHGVAVHHSDELMRRERLSSGDIPSASWWRSVALEAADRTGAPLGTPRDLERAGITSWW